MVVPAVVEKELVDIGLGTGVNERDRKELVEWAKYLTTAKNASLSDYRAITKRPGTALLAPKIDDASVAIAPNRRLLPLQDGVGAVSSSFQLYHLSEIDNKFVNKGRCPEFTTLSSTAMGATHVGSIVYGKLLACAVSTKYKLLCYEIASSVPVIIVCDRNSGSIVREWKGTSGLSSMDMVVVDDRYLHIYEAKATGNRFFQIDLAGTLPASGGITSGPVNYGPASTSVIVATVTKTGLSAHCYTNGGNTYIVTFNTSGALVATSAALAGIVTPTDMDTDGTSYYIVGMNVTPAGTMLVVSGALAVTRTVVNVTASDMTAASRLSLTVTPAGNAYIVAYNRKQSAAVAAIYYPAPEIWKCSTTDVTFQSPWGAAGTARVYGWAEACKPFYNVNTARCYVGFHRQLLANSGAAADRDTTTSGTFVLVDITDVDLTKSIPAFRTAATIDHYVDTLEYNDSEYGFLNTGRPRPRPIQTDSGYKVWVPEVYRSTSQSYGYEIHELAVMHPSGITVSNDVMSGSKCFLYDGARPQEIGYHETPILFAAVGAAGGVDAGIHSYVAVFEFKDASGRSHYSRTSRVTQVTPGIASDISLEIPGCLVTDHKSLVDAGVARIYRTEVSGSTFYQCATINIGTVVSTATDVMSDATLRTQPILFRHPGSANTPLDRYTPLSGKHIVRHKDRIFYCRGNTVYYSSFAVDGEAPWFNPVFNFTVPGGSGDITALASMDGLLIVFKRDAIFVVDGDGPPENGGTGMEFSTPKRINTEYGCTEPRSVVVVPDGVMYRSSRGIELLTRSGSVTWIGEMIDVTCRTYKYIHGAAFDRNNSRVLFGASNTITSGGTADVTGLGAVLAYDLSAKGWTTFVHSGYNSLTLPMQDVCYSRVYVAADAEDKERIIYMTSDADIVYEKTDAWTDTDSVETVFVSMVLETGWITIDSVQERIRLSDLLLLIKKVTNHNLKVSVAYDYSDTYTVLKTFQPAEINALTLEQLEIQVPKQAKMAFRFKIEDTAPSDTVTYPIGSGAGPEILAITPRLGKRGGGAKLAVGAKG